MIEIARRIAFKFYKTIGRYYLTPILLRDWKRSPFKRINERPLEYQFTLRHLSRVCPSEVLDVGSGTSSWPHIMAGCGFRVTAIDKISGYWNSGFLNRHYYVVNDDITKARLKKQFDFITCISVLEHIPEHGLAVKNMFELLRPGGYLALTFPYNEERYIDNVYEFSDRENGRAKSTFICQVFSRSEVDAWLKRNGGKLIDQEYYEVFSGDFWDFGNRIYPPRSATSQERHHLTCILMQKT